MMLTLDILLDLLGRYKYAAMFGVLLLCGLGLPLPEEVTLIASGLAVGLGTANFWLASLCCVAGILAGDAFIFAMGRYHGRRFLASRLMRGILTERRQDRIHRLFARHGRKAVFFARFLAGVRIGVYAYAGQHGMGWLRFLLLDLLGALISGPTSIWLGAFALRHLVDPDPDEAARLAQRWIHEGSYVIYGVFGLLVVLAVARWLWRRRGQKARPRCEGCAPRDAVGPRDVAGPREAAGPREGIGPREAAPVTSFSGAGSSRSGREAPPGAGSPRAGPPGATKAPSEPASHTPGCR